MRRGNRILTDSRRGVGVQPANAGLAMNGDEVSLIADFMKKAAE